MSENGELGALLASARAGDEQAFVAVTGPHRRALHLHCYRLLGSFHDADDALQETLLRAWRGLAGYENQASVSAWLYRIATNVCLRALERRGRDSGARVDERLQPYPDRLLDDLPSPEAGPEAAVEARESVGLAFIAAMQLLPPKQRAVLLLRDVLGWSAREAASALDDTVAAVNSALQRGRERLQREREAGTLARRHAPESAATEAALVRRWIDVWEAVDVDGMLALLRTDALMTMPPDPRRYEGREAIVEFLATVLLGDRHDRFTLVEGVANRQPLVALYTDDGSGAARIWALLVLAVDGDAISGITGFHDQPELFAEFEPATRLEQ